MSPIDTTGLTPEQVTALEAAVASAKTANEQEAAATPSAKEPADVPEAPVTTKTESTTEATTTTSQEPPADTAAETEEESAEGLVLTHVTELLDRLRLGKTGQAIGTVVDWLTEHNVKL